jgi:signal peptidase
MDLVGLTLFPAISANIYYHYTSKRYGMFPSTVLRTVITLYVYFIPNITGISNAMSACLKLFLPLGVLAFVSALYEKGKKNAIRRGQKLSTVTMIFAVLTVTFVAMLISCQFRFGALVIATESMTGEINKGDMIIYEQYDDQPIEVGQVIVFTQNNQNRIVHRVIKIETVNGEKRYYTQGDANPAPDDAYRTEADIIGLTDLKLAYVGYPTLWLKELLEGSN